MGTAEKDRKNKLVEICHLKTYFKKRAGGRLPVSVHAVDDVSLDINQGETLGLVGESGCGKSTLGRSLLRLVPMTSGRVVFDGKDITDLTEKQMRPLRKEMQIVFQDPYSSLNPRMTIGETIKAPLKAFREEGVRERIREIMQEVGLNENMLGRYPHEFSGGQRQRIAIARALILNPGFVVCDEPVSALDVSVKAQILNLMKELQEKRRLTYLFISHDLGVVKYLCDRIAVMYMGEIVEMAEGKALFEDPAHPYTRALLSAVPRINAPAPRGKKAILGELPDIYHLPEGCRFHTRCPEASEVCRTGKPGWVKIGRNHGAACHHISI